MSSLLLLAPAAGAPESTAPAGPVPFTAVYGVEWHGITAGYSTLELKQTGPDMYSYSSHIRARGIFRLAFPDVLTQISTFRILDGHVAPLTYHEDDGTSDESKQVSLTFDWQGLRVRGTAERKSVDQPLKPGTQDPFSVQIELMRDLAAGATPATFVLFDKHEAKEYRYTRERTEALDTPLGHLEAVVYRSDRPDSDRVTRLWLAPTLGFLPVQAERRRHDKVDFSLHIREVHR